MMVTYDTPTYKQVAKSMVRNDENSGYEYQIFTEDTFITLYHASAMEVCEPRWDYAKTVMGKEEAELRDFGLGFYACLDDVYPLKLASADRKNETLILNKYVANLKGLRYIEFELDLEWLLAIAFSRRDLGTRKWSHPLRDRCRKWLSGCDVAIGVISNDKTYDAIEDFIDNRLADNAAIAMVNAANYGKQYAFKSQLPCDRLKDGFQGSVSYTMEQIHQFRNKFAEEKREYDRKADSLRMDFVERGGGMVFDRIIRGELFDGKVRF